MYMGMDVHKKTIQVAMMDKNGSLYLIQNNQRVWEVFRVNPKTPESLAS